MRKTDRWQRRHVSIATVAALGLLLSPWRVWAQTAPYLFDLLKRPAFRNSFDALFANERNVDEWIIVFRKTGNGVCGPSKRVQTGSATYLAADVTGANRIAVAAKPETSLLFMSFPQKSARLRI